MQTHFVALRLMCSRDLAAHCVDAATLRVACSKGTLCALLATAAATCLVGLPAWPSDTAQVLEKCVLLRVSKCSCTKGAQNSPLACVQW
jgi:hypothetical protein